MLWQKENIQNRVLNIKTYQEINGVTGTLQKQADKIYNKFNEQERKAAEEIFLELISLEGLEVGYMLMQNSGMSYVSKMQ